MRGEISHGLECSYTLADASSRHKCLKFRQLDWFSALEADGISSIRDMMEEADPDFMLGADIVGS